jgi:hypothetical protein
MTELRPNMITINGFNVPSSYHQALSTLIDALTYGDISMSTKDVWIGPDGNQLDVESPAGFFLTTSQITDYISVSEPIEVFGEINFEAMSGMRLADLIEIQTWFNELKSKVSITANDANEVRLEMIDWLTTLQELRTDYPNPASV